METKTDTAKKQYTIETGGKTYILKSPLFEKEGAASTFLDFVFLDRIEKQIQKNESLTPSEKELLTDSTTKEVFDLISTRGALKKKFEVWGLLEISEKEASKAAILLNEISEVVLEKTLSFVDRELKRMVPFANNEKNSYRLSVLGAGKISAFPFDFQLEGADIKPEDLKIIPVSYTHLTLPTSDLV